MILTYLGPRIKKIEIRKKCKILLYKEEKKEKNWVTSYLIQSINF